jgi:hypothetical protein
MRLELDDWNASSAARRLPHRRVFRRIVRGMATVCHWPVGQAPAPAARQAGLFGLAYRPSVSSSDYPDVAGRIRKGGAIVCFGVFVTTELLGNL